MKIADRFLSPRQVRGFRLVAGAVVTVIVLQGALTWKASGLTKQIHERVYDTLYTSLIRQLKGRVNDPQTPDPLAVVFFGSSRFEQGVHGSTIETALSSIASRPVVAFSMAMASGDPVLQSVILERVLEDGCRPKIAILEIHPCLVSASEDLGDGSTWGHLGRLTDRERDRLEAVGMFSATPQRRGIWWHGRQAELKEQFRRQVDWNTDQGDIWIPPLPRRDRWGTFERHAVEDAPEEAKNRVINAHAEYAGKLKDLRLGGVRWRAVELMIERCHAEGIVPVVLRTPEGPAFRSWYGEGVADHVSEKLEELRRRKNVVVVDAWTWLDETDFWDSHHMTDPASRKFSARLCRETLAPLIAARPDGPFQPASLRRSNDR